MAHEPRMARFFKLDAPPVLCRHHHDEFFDTTPPTTTAIIHDDRLTYPHSRPADRGSEFERESKTVSVNDAGGHTRGHTNSCHESIVAGSNADASKPSLSADTPGPSPSARDHLLSKLPFPRRCQHPDTAPQPIALSKHDDMVPDAAVAVIEQVHGLSAQPYPLSCPSLPSATLRPAATSPSNIADMAVAALATISTHTFTAPVLSSFTSASTSTATPQQRDERSTEHASVVQHVRGHEDEHDASKLKRSNEHDVQGLHATPSASTVCTAAQVQAKENAGHSSLAIVNAEEWSKACSGVGRSQSRVTQARKGHAVSRSLDGHVGFSRSRSRRIQHIQYVRYDKEDEDDGTSDSAAEDVDEEDDTEYSGAETVDSDLGLEGFENSNSHEDAHTQEELEELQDGPPSALPPPLPPKGASFARSFPRRALADQVRTRYSVSDPGHTASSTSAPASTLVPARARTMAGYVSAHHYYSSRRTSWASVKQDAYPTMETILRNDDTSGAAHGQAGADAEPSSVYTQAKPMRRPMFYGANVSSTSAIGSEVAVVNGIVFPRKSGPASFGQSTLHTPVSMREEDFRSNTNWTTMSLASATSNGRQKRRRNKLRKPPPERVLQARRKSQASVVSMEEDVARWRASYVVDDDDDVFSMPGSASIMRRAREVNDRKDERPLSDTAIDYGQTYDAFCNDALYEFPPQSPAQPACVNSPQQGGKGKGAEGGRRLSVTFEDQGLKVEDHEHGHVCGRAAGPGQSSSGTMGTLARRDLLESTDIPDILPNTHRGPSSSSLLPLPTQVPQTQPLPRPSALPPQQQPHLLHPHNGYMRPQLSVRPQNPALLNRSTTDSSGTSMSVASPGSSRSGSKASSTIASAASTAPTSPGLSDEGKGAGFVTLDGEGEGKEYFVGVKAGGEELKAPILEARTMSSLVGDGQMKGKRGKLVKKRPGASVVSLALSVSMEKQKKEEEPIVADGARATRNMLGIRFSSLSERGKNGRNISARDGELRDSDLRQPEMLPPMRPPSPLWAGCGSVLLSPYARFSSKSQAQTVDPVPTSSKTRPTATATDALASLAFTGNTGMSSSALAALTSRMSRQQQHTLNGAFDLAMSPAEEKLEGEFYDPYAELGRLKKGKGKEREHQEHDASGHEHGRQRGSWATTTLARKAKELGRRSSLSLRKLDEHKPGFQANSASKSASSSGPVMPIPSPTFSRPPIPRRRSKTLSISNKRNFSIRRWTLAMADVPDEVLVQELERIRLEGRGRRRRAASSQGHGQTSATGQKEPDEKAFVYGGPGCASIEASGSSGSHGRDDDVESIASDSTDSHSPEHGDGGGETDEREDAEWKTARRALLCCRELVRTERSYQNKLRQLLAGDTAMPPSALILTYVPALLSASEALLARLEDDPSAWGVSVGFVAVEEELESAFVAWCGVVGEIFIGDERDETEKDRLPRRVSTSAKIAEDNGGTWGLRKRSRSGVSVGRMESIYRKRATSYVEGESDTGNLSNGLGMFTAALGTGLAYGISPPTASSNQQDEIVMKTRRSRQVTSNASGPLLSRTLSSWRRASLLSSSGSLVQSSPSSPSAVHASPTQKDKKPSVRELAIQPTQRIMRYVLQYRDLLENTPVESPSRGLVERALESATRIAGKCDRAQGNSAFLRRA